MDIKIFKNNQGYHPFKLQSLMLFVCGVFVLVPESVQAQCAMCRAVLESEGSVAAAEGINNGIVYLMAIPYLLIAGLFFVIYKKMKT